MMLISLIIANFYFQVYKEVIHDTRKQRYILLSCIKRLLPFDGDRTYSYNAYMSVLLSRV